MKHITRTPLFWVIATVGVLGAIVFSIRFFSSAIPLVHANITTTRADAYALAQQCAEQYTIGPKEYMQAAYFVTDHLAQTFIELEGGGKPAFIEMLEKHTYEPYTWHVRHMQENNVHEAHFFFTPDGKPYGFMEIISENNPGAALSAAEAQAIAEAGAVVWNINLQEYTLVEPSTTIRPGGRVDHDFVYERRNERITEEGSYRLRLSVHGDHLGNVKHFVHVPESFQRRYHEMRSANHHISWIASMLYIILYGFGGLCIGLLVLQKKKYILWKPACIVGIIGAVASLMAFLNSYPLDLMHYHTALSKTTFLMSWAIQGFLRFIMTFIGITLIVGVAEALTRKAFGKPAQLWQLWKNSHASSYTVFGQTIGGYFVACLHFGYVIAFYLIAMRCKGWWMPLESLYDPNILSTYLPCFGPIYTALYAGLTEECIFRAIPLAGAALIGSRLKKRNVCIGIAFIVQALIFSAAHANYPTQPAYARLIELLIPSTIFGSLYLMFGLFPAIISHVIYDVVWMAMPVFIWTGIFAHINQILVVLFALIPLLIALFAYAKKRRLTELPADSYNNAWQPPVTSIVEKEEVVPEKMTYSISKKTISLVCILAVVSVFMFKQFRPEKSAPTMTVTLSEAKNIAHAYLTEQNVTLDTSWKILPAAYTTYVLTDNYEHRFIWQKAPELYHILMTDHYLTQPHWNVRFARFEGDIVQRAEEYHISIDCNGTVFQMQHILPESTPGPSLTEQEARVIAHTALKNMYQLDAQNVTEISASAQKHPQRKDWVFTFSNPTQYPLDTGQARIVITIAGDTVTFGHKYIHVPEEWQRATNNSDSQVSILHILSLIFLLVSFIASIAYAYGSLSGLYIPYTLFCSIFVMHILSTINSWPSLVAYLSTSKPLLMQYVEIIGMQSLFIFMFTFFLTGIIAATFRSRITSMYTATTAKQHFLDSALALIAVATITAASHLFCVKTPCWADYSALNGYIPAFAVFVRYFSSFLIVTSFLLLFSGLLQYYTAYGTRRQAQAFFFWFLLGFIASKMEKLPDVTSWLIVGSITGILLIFLSVAFNKDRTRIPPIIAQYITWTLVQQALLNPLGSFFPFVATGLICCAASYVWRKKLSQQYI